MKRKLCMALSALMMVSGMAGFGIVAGASDGDVTLRYGIWDDNQKAALREIADKFEEENPGIKVEIEVTPWKDYWTTLETSATGGSAPDVFWMNAPHFAMYAQGGMLTSLDDAIGDSEVASKADFPESLVDMYSDNGVWYGMPKGFDTIAVYYNKELFDNAGVAYPTTDWTWDDYVSIAKQLTDADNGVYGTALQLDEQAGWYNTVAMFGGEILNEDKTASGFDDPNTQKGIQCWVDLLDEGVSPTYAQLTDTGLSDMFRSGKVAMMFGGSYSLSGFMADEEFADKFDCVELPSVDGNKACVIHGLGNVIYSQSANQEAAAKFVEFLGGKEAMTMQAEAGIDISARTDCQNIWVDSNKNYNLQAFMNMVDYSYAYPATMNTSSWMSPMYDEVYAAFNKDKTVEEACADATAEMNEALAQQ